MNMMHRFMRKALLLTLLLAVSHIVHAQRNDLLPRAQVGYTSYAGSGDALPFWLTTNRNGAITSNDQMVQLFEAGFLRTMEADSAKAFGLTYGAKLVGNLASDSKLHLNQGWLGVRYKWLVLTAGMRSDAVRFGGLSTTNANIMQSNNARPLPGLSLATDGFIPFLFWKEWFTFQAQYDEYQFYDDRLIPDANLHHKKLSLKADLNQNWHLVAGLDHWVFWGGTSPTLGKMPESFDDYLRYVMGRAGSDAAPATDQANAAGNSLGMLFLEIEKEYPNVILTFICNHPFDDASGMEFENFWDGLYGLHLKKKDNTRLLTEVMIEGMYTLDQSGTYHLVPDPRPDDPNHKTGRGMDDYFNHGVYKSGFVHFDRMMGTPLFIPQFDENGIPMGFESSRMWMLHGGAKGMLSPRLSWKGMATFSRNFGRFGASYPKHIDQWSFLLEGSYQWPNSNLHLNAGLAVDLGDRLEKQAGGYLGLNWRVW